VSERRARQAIVVGAALVAGGIAALGAWGGVAAGVVLLVGWLELVYAIHAFGRAGGG
jgi:hypothetical protein